MTALREVVAACLAAAQAGRRGVLATVVRVEGSAYRRPGARMFLPADGPPIGLVSGGCLETDLAERAAAVLTANEPQTVLYDMRSPDDVVWGLGLGCNGAIRVLLEPVGGGSPPADLEFLDACDKSRTAGVVVTVSETTTPPETAAVGQRMLVDVSGTVSRPLPNAAATARLADVAGEVLAARRSRDVQIEIPGGTLAALVEYVQPAIRLIVCGAGHDAQPVVEQAAALGWHVHVLDHRPHFANPECFPAAVDVRVVEWSRLTVADLPLDARTAVVLMTHHFLHDVDVLAALVPRGPRYVGLLGPRQRAENLIAALAERDVPLDAESRELLHGPVGLDVGSETPEEIALSLVAEIQAVFAGRHGGPLRDRTRPLHDWPA